MLVLLAALAAVPPDTVRPAVPAPAPQEAPAVVVHRQPALPLVALRLSVLAPDPSGHAGAGHLVQHLVLPELEERVARVGGRVQAVRSPDAVVYTVVGPAAELEHLAASLRAALRVPPAGTAQTLAALNRLAEERAAERETADGWVRAALRGGLFPDERPAAGTDASAARLATARLPEVWATMYRPDRVAIVAVGDVEPADVRGALQDLPAPGAAPLDDLPADTLLPADRSVPQATRGWTAVGWPADGADPAAVTVAARLLRDDLRARLPAGDARAEHWWTHDGQALVALAAVPGPGLEEASAALRGGLDRLRARLADDGETVRAAAAGVRRDLLFFSRTPERMAELIGSFVDRGGDPGAAQRFYDELDAVEPGDVLALLDSLAAREPVAVVLPPQAIPEANRR